MSMIDQQSALSLLGGNERIYLKFLQKFITSSNAGKYTITEDTVKSDFEHAARTFHTMKGLSENIGALSIKDVAVKLDAAAKEHNESAILLGLDEYNHLLNAITAEAETIVH